MKPIFFCLKLFLLLVIKTSFGQLENFNIGIYSFDYNNNPWLIPEGTNRAVGNDYNFLKLFKDVNINYIQIEYQLNKPLQHANSFPDKHFLDTAQYLNLKILLNSPDLQIDKNNPIYNHTNSINALNYFNHSALLGYVLADEPEPNCFNTIKQYFEDIKTFNPQLLRYCCLLPMYADVRRLGSPLGTSPHIAYEKYVRDYVNITEPNVLAFDHYPTWVKPTPLDLFYNLEIINKIAIEKEIPFFYVLTPIKDVGWPNYITKNKYEFNYVINAALVYGAKGLSYWHAGHSYRCWDEAIPQDVLEHLHGMHNKIKKHENVLMNLSFKGAFHKTNISTIQPNMNELIPDSSLWQNIINNFYADQVLDLSNPIQPINNMSDENILISFHTDKNYKIYFWIFNKNITSSTEIKINLKRTSTLIDILDENIQPLINSFNVYLGPGEAKLYKVNFDYTNSLNFCNELFSNNSYTEYYAKNILFGGEDCFINFTNNSNYSFNANKIILNNKIKFNEGCNVSFNTYQFINQAPNIDDQLKNFRLKQNSISLINNLYNIYYIKNTEPIKLFFDIKFDELVKVELYNSIGSFIANLPFRENNIIINNNQSHGLYLIKVFSKNKVELKKIVL